MNAYQTLDYSINDSVATIQLLHQHSTMKMVRELTAVCDHLEDHSSCQVVVFKGANGCFSKGIDFAEFRPDAPMDIHGFNKWEKMCRRIETLPKATIALLEGEVIGGGVQLALCTDVRIATPGATLSLPEVSLGFLPGMAVFRLAKYIGLGRAKQIILRGLPITAAQGHSLGLVDSLCEQDALDEQLASLISEFLPLNPIAHQLARRLLNESFEDSFENAIGHFLAAQQRAVSQPAFNQTIRKQS